MQTRFAARPTRACAVWDVTYTQARFGEIWSAWEEVVGLRHATARAIGVAIGLVATAGVVAWSPAGAAGSTPTAALARLARGLPGFVPGDVMITAWTVFPVRHGSPSPQTAARLALARAAGPTRADRGSPVAVRGIGPVAAWTMAGVSAAVQERPASAALGLPAAIELELSTHASTWPAASALTQRLSSALAPLGSTRVAIRVAGAVPAGRVPLVWADRVVATLGAARVEAVGGPRAALVLARVAGVPSVEVAGRWVNVEVAVGRTSRGLLVDVASPVLAPGEDPAAAGA